MPELPEVETVCRGLEQSIKGGIFASVDQRRPNLRIPFPDNFPEKLTGRSISSIKRRAKYILMTLDNDDVIIAHLGMSGKIIVHNKFRNEINKHDHLIFRMADGKEVVYNDPRRFGLITISNTTEINEHPLIKDLGIEPLEDEFNGERLKQLMSGKKTAVKIALMDASLVVGVGNIYACEALFRSRIHPEKPAGDLTINQYNTLAANIKNVLDESIKSGGSTLRDYVRSSGDAGYFQHNFSVYGKEGDACNSCGKSIARIKQTGRSTFFCPSCQK